MLLPNRERAIIAPEKITDYLLNVMHRRGGPKARLLLEFGYEREHWQHLVDDISRDHLEVEVTKVSTTAYGIRYEIRAPLQTPSGRPLTVRTIWQVDIGSGIPRLITLVPD